MLVLDLLGELPELPRGKDTVKWESGPNVKGLEMESEKREARSASGRAAGGPRLTVVLSGSSRLSAPPFKSLTVTFTMVAGLGR